MRACCPGLRRASGEAPLAQARAIAACAERPRTSAARAVPGRGKRAPASSRTGSSEPEPRFKHW